MVHRRTLRGLIWASLGLQLGGLVYDIFWHALHSGFEATTRVEMLEHLATVHVPIYLGVLCVVLTTAMALFRQVSLGDHGAALPIAFVGALISAIGETWHAYKHLQLATSRWPACRSRLVLRLSPGRQRAVAQPAHRPWSSGR
jgi:hypothetical protein